MGSAVKVIGNREHNYAHNSGFAFSQRGPMATQSALSTTNYAADRWLYRFEAGAGTLTYRARQNNIGPNTAALWGFHGECLSGSSTGVVQNHARQILEKSEVRKLLTDGAGVFTFGFWYQSNRTGLHGIALDLSLGGTAFSATYSQQSFDVPVAGVWQYVSATFTLTGLTVLGGAETGGGLLFNIGPTAGNSNITTWNSGDYFYISQVQLNPGPRAFDWRLCGLDSGGELAICQRYYEKSYDVDTAPGSATNNGMVNGSTGEASRNVSVVSVFKVQKRTVPAMTYYDLAGNINRASFVNAGTGAQTDNVNPFSTQHAGQHAAQWYGSTSAGGTFGFYRTHFVASAEF